MTRFTQRRFADALTQRVAYRLSEPEPSSGSFQPRDEEDVIACQRELVLAS